MLFSRSYVTRRLVVLFLTFAFLAISQQDIQAGTYADCSRSGGTWTQGTPGRRNSGTCNRPLNKLIVPVAIVAGAAIFIAYLFTRDKDDEADPPAASRSTRSRPVEQSFDESVVANVSESIRTRFGQSAHYGTAD